MNRKPLLLFTLSLLFLHQATLCSAELEVEISNLTSQVVTAVDQADVRTIAITDFTDLEENTSQLGRFLADEISTELVMAKKRFALVDRANLKKIMAENKLTVSGLVDPENAKKLGQIAGVDAIVIGTVTQLDKSVRVTIKIIATDTAKIIGAARGQISRTASVEKLAGNEIATDDAVADRNARAKAPILKLGEVAATVDWAKLSDRGLLDVSLTFINNGKRTCWIIPAAGEAAQASDDAKNVYTWVRAEGFFRSPLDFRREGLRNSAHIFLRLDPNVPTVGSLQFSKKHDSRRDIENPTMVRFFSRFTVVGDMKTFTSRDYTLSTSVDLE